MRGKTIIYWSNVPLLSGELSHINGMYSRNLLTFPPISVTQLFREKYADDPDVLNYLKCPAAQTQFKNLYAVRADADLTFRYTKENNIEIKQPSSFKVGDMFGIRSHKSRFYTLNIPFLFYSESNMEMAEYPAFFEDNDFVNKTILTTGKFNISKWFRSVDPTFLIKAKEKEDISIKRGDVLFYVKFYTNKRIKFKEFIYTNTINQFMTSGTILKFFLKNQSLLKLYEFFANKNYKKRILKEIKANLVE